MLWSLIKIVLFISLVAALTLGVGYLAETSGGVRITVSNTEYNLDPLHTAIAAVVLVLVIWLGLKVASFLLATVRFINGDETAISRYFDRNRERKGFEALADGMTALASGEGSLAMAKATKAEKYLKRPELTNLITAQAAEISGDRRLATEVYKRLLQNDRTRFVGIRGIMKQKLENGETDVAMQLAQKAFALKPKHTETGDLLLRLQAEHQDWSGARKTLAEKQRQGVLPRDVHKRRDAVMALSQAQEIFADGTTIEAREAAIEASRLSPDLIPAAVIAARAYIVNAKPKYATRVIKKAWEAQPHPDLAAAFASISPDETPAERIKRFQPLIKAAPDHPETRMLQGELFIAAADYPAARKAVADLAENDPTARSLAIMAAIERGEGSDDAVVRGWLTKAVTASRGPQWVCANCQTVHSTWAPVCSNCSGFDTLSWAVPADGEVAMPASSEMLPLLAGQAEDKQPDTGEKDTDVIGEVVILPDEITGEK